MKLLSIKWQVLLRYDTVYLAYSKKLTEEKTKNKLMSMISPVPVPVACWAFVVIPETDMQIVS